MKTNPPYVPAPGNITKVLQKIKEAATPERFTLDFLETKLGLSGGSATPLIPFLKRIGLLSSDGKPTTIYKRFRNPMESGIAIAEAIKIGYKDLYQINEYVHELKDDKLKGVITQLTGLEHDARVTQLIVSSFSCLKAFANFEISENEVKKEEQTPIKQDLLIEIPKVNPKVNESLGMNLSYTINLNLPATSDIAVFNSIFKSLREHLLKGD